MRQEAVLGKPCVTCIEPEKCRKLHCSNMGEVVYYMKAILYHFCNSRGAWEALVFYNNVFPPQRLKGTSLFLEQTPTWTHG